MDNLSDAQALWLAVQSAASSDLTRLRQLAATRRDVLPSAMVYRILLTYLPLDADTEIEGQLLLLLEDLDQDVAQDNSIPVQVDQEHLQVPPTQEAETSLAELRLEKVPIWDKDAPLDALSDFVIAWIHKLEVVASISPTSLQLAERFSQTHPVLQTWTDSFLRPLHRLQTEFYMESPNTVSLHHLESIHGAAGVAALLDLAVQSREPANVARDLEELVSPWMRGATGAKRRKLSTQAAEEPGRASAGWDNINEWLLSIAQKDFDLAAGAVEQWNGPPADDGAVGHAILDDTIAYVRAVLGLVYVSAEADDVNRVQTKKRLLRRVTGLAQLMSPDFDITLPDIPPSPGVSQASRSDLMTNKLLDPQNHLTRPSSDVVDFLYGILSTQTVLGDFKLESTTRSVTTTVLFDSEDRQKQELRTILAQFPRLSRSTLSWTDLRQRLHWLRTWSRAMVEHDDESPAGFLGRLPKEYLEIEILNAMLAAGQFEEVKDTYLHAHEHPLPLERVLDSVLAAILSAYDNASNGNRSRGGVKKASDILQAFASSFPHSDSFTQLEHLLKATHGLSFYHLTLQHGVPFQPVSIRAASDPLSLIEKVLDQNNKAYTKLDDLIAIGRNLVLAGLPTPPPPDYAPGEAVPPGRKLFDAEHRITYSAINAALADHDFDTAYSLITTRFRKPDTADDGFVDDTTWRAAYAAGRYRPVSSPQDIHKQIAALQKRMELLSKALTLAPAGEALPEILMTWRRCEEELDSLKSQALQEERAMEAQSDALLPGGFGPSDRDLDANETRRMLESRRAHNTTAPSYEEEAPMGLFDVARGAASALRKNAFPLRGAGQQSGGGIKVRDPPTQSVDRGMRTSGELERPGSADGQRVRKRDMISNAVTGGFVSGMSWVLGAQPVSRDQGQQ